MRLQIHPALNIRSKKAGKPQSRVRSDAATLPDNFIDACWSYFNSARQRITPAHSLAAPVSTVVARPAAEGGGVVAIVMSCFTGVLT